MSIKVKHPACRSVGYRKWELIQDYSFDFKEVNITIKRGFTFDGATIPQMAWSTLGLVPGGIMLAVALPHDFLYRYYGKLGYKTAKQKRILSYTKKDCDDLFLKMMQSLFKENNVSLWKSKACYRAVRVFGNKYWGIRRNEGDYFARLIQ